MTWQKRTNIVGDEENKMKDSLMEVATTRGFDGWLAKKHKKSATTLKFAHSFNTMHSTTTTQHNNT